MAIRSGRLKQQVQIIREATTGGKDRMNNPVTSETVSNTRRCEITPISGSEFFEADQQKSTLTHKIRFRYEAGLVTRFDILRDVSVSPPIDYRVTAPPINPGSENRELVCMCEIIG